MKRFFTSALTLGITLLMPPCVFIKYTAPGNALHLFVKNYKEFPTVGAQATIGSPSHIENQYQGSPVIEGLSKAYKENGRTSATFV